MSDERADQNIRWRSGVYRILGDAADSGTEAWSHEIGPDRVRLTSVVMRTAPELFEEEIDIELDGDWRPVRLTVERSSSLGERRYVGRRVGDAWISQVFRESGPLKTVTQPFGADTHVDYFTPHTNRITIQRLALEPGEMSQIEVVFIDPETFTPALVRQVYTRLPDPSAEPIGGAPAARRYRYQGASGFKSTILVDDEGVILRYDDLFELIEV
jgi:hypothetical protein